MIMEAICPKCKSIFQYIGENPPKEGTFCPSCDGNIKGVLYFNDVDPTGNEVNQEWEYPSREHCRKLQKLPIPLETESVWCDADGEWAFGPWDYFSTHFYGCTCISAPSRLELRKILCNYISNRLSPSSFYFEIKDRTLFLIIPELNIKVDTQLPPNEIVNWVIEIVSRIERLSK